jgi:phage-related protein (TIGR01555 family)
MGLPMYYDVIADGLALQRQRIHHSRIIRFDGVTLPYWQGFTESLWGQSIIERIYDRLVAFDSTTAGVAQLVYKAHLRTLTVEGLRTILAAGGSAEAALIKNVDMIRRFQSNEGLTLIDGKDKLDSSSYTFTGLDAVLLQFGQQLSGATGIPLVRLFGQSPSGMSATGESDIRNYYDNIKQGQERKLRNPMTVLLDLMCRSELNVEPPEDLAFSFNPLWQMSDTEKAEIAVKVTTAVTAANEAGLISDQAAMQELRDSAEITGVFANITDEQIKNADDQPPEPAPPEPNPGSEGPENSERAGAAGTQSGERVREAVA